MMAPILCVQPLQPLSQAPSTMCSSLLFSLDVSPYAGLSMRSSAISIYSSPLCVPRRVRRLDSLLIGIVFFCRLRRTPSTPCVRQSWRMLLAPSPTASISANRMLVACRYGQEALLIAGSILAERRGTRAYHQLEQQLMLARACCASCTSLTVD